MKQQLKREITAVSNKKRAAKCAFPNCHDINELINAGRFQSLVIVEGYYVLGVERGYWRSVAGMFEQFNAIGLKYNVCSYSRFRCGSHYYVPSAFLSALSACLCVSYPVAYAAGLPVALKTVSRFPSRWGAIPLGLAA